MVQRLVLFAKESGKKARLFRVVGMALALLRLWNAAHHHVNVLAATSPGGFATFAAGYF